VDAAIRKALEKLPADRFSGAQPFATALADPGFRHGMETSGASPGGSLWKPLSLATSGMAFVLALALGWSILGSRSAPVPRPVSRLVVSAAPSAPVVPSPIFSDVVISPDGSRIVYESAWNPGEFAIRQVDQLESVTFSQNGANPFFSPDGAWMGFQSGQVGTLQRVSTLGGPPSTIADLRADLQGASWGPDGTIVFGLGLTEGLWQVSASGGEPTPLTVTDGTANHGHPNVLPNGRGVLFVVSTTPATTTDDQIAVLDRQTGDYRVVIQAGTSPRYVSSGHIVYAVGSTLSAVAFDADRLEVLTDPVPLVEGVMVKASGAASFSVSETGSLVYVSGSAADVGLRSFVWVERDGREEPLPLPPRSYQNPRLSPDGTRVAVGVPDESGTLALWVFDVVSAAGLRLTQQGTTQTPVWISDARLAYSSNASGGVFQIHSVMADGSEEPRHLLGSEGIVGDFPTAVSADGASLIFSRMVTQTHREILRMPLDGEPVPQTLLQGEFNRGNAEVSPNGRWLVYRSDQSGQMEVYVQPYPGPGPVVPASIGGGTSVTWSPDGTELIYRLDDRMMAASVTEVGETVRIGQPTELFRGPYYAPALGGTRQYHIAPDGRFLMLKAVEPGDASEELPPQVILVQNWFEELRERVPSS
jgi:hypothetical protein